MRSCSPTRCRTCRSASTSPSSTPASGVIAGPSRCATRTAGSSSARTTGCSLPAAERAGIADGARARQPRRMRSSRSHGRSTAAICSPPRRPTWRCGVPLGELGPPIDPEALVRLELPEPSFAEGRPRDDAVRRQLREHRPQPDARRSRAGRGSSRGRRSSWSWAESATTPSRRGRLPTPGQAT